MFKITLKILPIDRWRTTRFLVVTLFHKIIRPDILLRETVHTVCTRIRIDGAINANSR